MAINNRQNVVMTDRYGAAAPVRDKRRFFADEKDPLHAAFDRKAGVHPRGRGRPIPASDIPGIWEEAMEAPGGKGGEERAAYFHIPFCESRCLYCGFHANPFSRPEGDRYVDYLLREMTMTSAATFIASHPFHAVYLGGGTPTALSADNLSRLLRGIKTCLPLAGDCELTVEGRTHNFPEDKVIACIQGGANRFSLGVQSFDTRVRRQMGRIETGDDVSRHLTRLKAMSQTVVVIDLIYGLPGQTMEIWENDVRRCIELGLDGVSLYQLNVYDQGRLQEAAGKGLVAPPADVSVQADMFAASVDIMQRARYRRTSLSHWGRTTRERSLYNNLALSSSVCIPFGCGAGGTAGGYSFMQDRVLDDYYRKIDAGVKPIALCTGRPPGDSLFREITRQVTLGYCDLRALGERYGLELELICLPILEQWEAVGLIERLNGSLELTLAGQFWSVNLCQNLIDWCADALERGENDAAEAMNG
jgi:oxygen-independent coproporphyrinogen-3 oxidase